jgi:hypothetical protein
MYCNRVTGLEEISEITVHEDVTGSNQKLQIDLAVPNLFRSGEWK